MLIHHDHQTSKERTFRLGFAIGDVATIVVLAAIVWLGFALLSPTNESVEHVQGSTAVPDVAPPPRFNPTTTIVQDPSEAASAVAMILARASETYHFDEPGDIKILPTQDGVRVVTFVQPPEIGGLMVEVVDDRQHTVATHDAFGKIATNVDELAAGTYRLVFGWEAPIATHNEVAISTAGLAMSDAFVIETGDELVIGIPESGA